MIKHTKKKMYQALEKYMKAREEAMASRDEKIVSKIHKLQKELDILEKKSMKTMDPKLKKKTLQARNEFCKSIKGNSIHDIMELV